MRTHKAAYANESAQSPGWLTGAVLQRKCGCGQHTGGGSCASCEKKKMAGLQAKLTIGEADDVYEREADLVADRLMSSSGRGSVKPAPLQVQRYAGVSAGSGGSVPASVSGTLGQSGMPLPRAVRQDMETRFGHDFSEVRVHSGTSAASSAMEINALAYTVGNNIVFGAGRFAPDTQQGQRLLAHELTHVVQQRGGVSRSIQRQPSDSDEVNKEDFKKELEKDGILDKLEKAARDKIRKEIDDLPKTVTKFMVNKIIDLTVTDPQYNQALKTTAEGIIDVLTKKGKPSRSICDQPPLYHEGGSSGFRGMCCRGSTESAQDCCPKDKFAPNNNGPSGWCCAADEFVNANKQCEKFQPVTPVPTVCDPPSKPDMFGRCCKPPLEVIGGVCTFVKPPAPPPQPFTLKFKLGVLDDYNIDESTINSRQKPHYEELKKQITGFLEKCPGSIITLTGFADAPGTEEHNRDLGQRRADHIKFLLQLELMKAKPSGIGPLIFAGSEGEGNPVDKEAGEKFSKRNRRVEIEFNSVCPPLTLSPPSLPEPRFKRPLLPGSLTLGPF